MRRYITPDGRPLSIFSPITRQELDGIPDARQWAGRQDFIADGAYKEIQLLIAEAFGDQSPDYVLGYVSGFNACIDRLCGLFQEDESYEVVWNKLMLLLSEVARHVSKEHAPDGDDYVTLELPDSAPN